MIFEIYVMQFKINVTKYHIILSQHERMYMFLLFHVLFHPHQLSLNINYFHGSGPSVGPSPPPGAGLPDPSAAWRLLPDTMSSILSSSIAV